MAGEVTVIGGGPAGCSAAIAAAREGAAVTIYEPARGPRHKVCGEFLSGRIVPVLERMRLFGRFEQAGPARIHEARLNFGRNEKRFRLPEPAYSLSRFALDGMLRTEAVESGARFVNERARAGTAPREVIAHGRSSLAPPGDRLFGFKAHFHGPANDAVELFFFDHAYAGVSPVEGGWTNVCGLAPEAALRSVEFRPERLFPEELRERLRPLTQAFQWLVTGPLVLGRTRSARDRYLAGDALGFIDPFTGSGIVNALASGFLAGKSAALGVPAPAYLAQVRQAVGLQYRAAFVFRKAIAAGIAGPLARWLPGELLYNLSRPGW